MELDHANTVSSTARDINADGVVVGWGEMPGGGGAPTRAVLWADGVLTDLGSLDGAWNGASGINDNGLVVGYSRYADARAFLWNDGVISDLGGPSGAEANAINASGTAVGVTRLGNLAYTTAVVWQNGIRTPLPTFTPCPTTPCFKTDAAHDINDSGQIVGKVDSHAALWETGTVIGLGTLGGTNSEAFGINANGDIVGSAQLSSGHTRAFLRKNGVMADLGTLGDATSYSAASDINASGQVVGHSTLTNAALTPDNLHAFLWQDGVMYDLNALTAGSGWAITYAFAINDAGQIAAAGHKDGGASRALLLNPSGLQTGAGPTHTVYLAEGATSPTFFDTQLSLLNPTGFGTLARLTSTLGNGQAIEHEVKVPGRTRRTVFPRTLPGLAQAEFATRVDSARRLVVDRTMTWNVATGYGSHAERAVEAPSSIWYLAEGATHSGFELFYLVQNPGSTDANVQVSYLLPASQAPIVKNYVVKANSRFNIWVNQEGGALGSTDVSAVITSGGTPIIVERAMYRNTAGQQFSAGHNSAGVTAPATNWFLAEGATGSYFDMFVLIANPNDADATITATYLLPVGAPLEKTYTVKANARFNIWVDLEHASLADTAVSMTLDSSLPVIVERSMWWPHGSTNWLEAHNSPGATTTGTRWALAEGQVGGGRAAQTYVLVANTSAFPGDAKVTVFLDDDMSVTRTFPLKATSRFNIDMGYEFPQTVNRRFGVLVESVGDAPAQIVVERAMYSNAGGVQWAAGTNALATKLQ